MKNYYEILGITSNATLEEIRKAYYKQERKYHPDNNPGQDTTDMMQQITLAYNTLSDKQSKKQYDATLRREQDQTSFNNTTTNTNGSYTHTQNTEDLWHFFNEYFYEQYSNGNGQMGQEKRKQSQQEQKERLKQQKAFLKNLDIEYYTMSNKFELQKKLDSFKKIKMFKK